MAEIWVRMVRREGSWCDAPLTDSSREVWDALCDAVRNGWPDHDPAWADHIDVAPPVPSTTLPELLATLDALPPLRLMHLFVVLLVPVGGDARFQEFADRLEALPALFPEVMFRIILGHDACATSTSGPDDDPAKRDAVVLRCSTGTEVGQVGDAAKDYFAGYREWFDVSGARWLFRAKQWDPEVESTVCLPPAWIVEDEKAYAELLAYAAYRTGAYRPEIVNSEATFDRRLVRAGSAICRGINSACDSAVVVHALDLPFSPFKGKLKETMIDEWTNVVQPLRCHRSIVTGARDEWLKIIPPRKWKDGVDDRLGWIKTEGKHQEGEHQSVRGLSKPLGWLHGVLSSGLFPAAHDDPLTVALFDGSVPTKRENDHHSAPEKAEAVAQALLSRAPRYLEMGEPFMAAVLALDAVRLLRAKSATLFLDAVEALYAAEVHIELDMGAAAAGVVEDDLRARCRELQGLLDRLDRSGTISAEMSSDLRERIWTRLRQQYQEKGVFEAADEALYEIHRSRNLKRGAGRLLRKTETTRRLAHDYPVARWAAFGIGWLVLLGVVVFAGRTHSPAYDLITAVATLIGLAITIWLYPDGLGWVGPAIRPSRWLITLMLSVALLATANVGVFCGMGTCSHEQESPPRDQPGPRPSEQSWGAYLRELPGRLPGAAFWTVGFAVGAQVLPTTFTLPRSEANVDFLRAYELDSVGQELLWLENFVTGWALFAFGLSAIYRRAVRG